MANIHAGDGQPLMLGCCWGEMTILILMLLLSNIKEFDLRSSHSYAAVCISELSNHYIFSDIHPNRRGRTTFNWRIDQSAPVL